MFFLNGLDATKSAAIPKNLLLQFKPSSVFNPAGGTVTTPPITPGTTATVTTPTPWYMSWWGLGLIGLAGYIGYTKFVKKPAAKAA